MTRHQRNATASTVYTHHERKKDQKESGYGSLNERLSKDAVKNFDCCSLTLQPCREPVVSPDGFLFDKEAILEYIVHQKREIARKQKEYEKQRQKEQKELEDLAKAELETKTKRFVAQESTPARPSVADDDVETKSSSSGSISNTATGKKHLLPSFWVPSVTGPSLDVKLEKPDTKIYCPVSGKVLKFKDLIPVHFTPVKNGDTDKPVSISAKERYVCAVSGDVLTNTTLCAVLKTSGSVVTMDCIENIIKKDWLDPTNGKPLTENDIIRLQRGGTGFSATNEKLKATLVRPVMELQ